jgi:hypothetical protein
LHQQRFVTLRPHYSTREQYENKRRAYLFHS